MASAQTVLWDKTYGGNRSDYLSSLQQTRDGGYIAWGTTESGKSGDKTEISRDTNKDSPDHGDYWLLKLRADGTKAWDKTIGGRGTERLTTVLPTSDGGYILAGTSNSGVGGDKSQPSLDESSLPYYSKSDIWLVKLNADGSKAWDKTLGSKVAENVSAFEQLADGSYILSSVIINEGDNYNIIKLNAKGEVIKTKSIRGLWFRSIEATRDGGFVLGGTIQRNGDGYNDFLLTKWDTNLNQEWSKTYGGDRDDELVKVQPTSDGGYILGGTSYSPISGDKTQASRGFTDYWVVKVKADGTKVWDTTVGGSEGEDLKSIQQTKDGGYILAGTSISNKSGEKSEDNTLLERPDGVPDYWLVKLSSDGSFFSDKTIGGGGYEYCSAVQQTTDGNFIIGGTSSSPISGNKSQNSRGREDFWIVKLKNDFLRNQDITFKPIVNKEINDPAFALTAKASSGLPVTFEVLSGPARLNGNKVTVAGAGTVRVAAIQAGNGSYKPYSTTQSFEVTLTGKQQQMRFGGSQMDTLTTLIATADGGYLLGGVSDSPITGDKSQGSKGDTDFWVVKTDKNGRKIWDKTFGGNTPDRLMAMVATADGGYLLGGKSASAKSGDKSQESKGKTDYWIIKIDNNGHKLWDQTYGGSQDDILASIVATPDGGYLLGGTSVSGQSGDKSQPTRDLINNKYYSGDYWVLKIDGKGQKIWDKTYGGTRVDRLSSILAVPEGGYLVGGYSGSGISGEKSQEVRAIVDYWVVRINEQGAKIWDQTYGGIKGLALYDWYIDVGESRLSTMVNTPDGGFLLGGSSSAFVGAEKTEGRINSPDEVYSDEAFNNWVLKIDRNGKKVWDKIYGKAESYLSTLIRLPEGGYLLAGTANIVLKDYQIIKIEEQGKVVEERVLGGFDNDLLATAIRITSGDILLAGTSFSGLGADKNTESRGKADFWAVQVSANKVPEPLAASWDKTYGGGGDDKIIDVIKTSDGGYFSLGYSNSSLDNGDISGLRPGQLGTNFWVVKSDRNGKKLWTKILGGAKDDTPSRVIQTQDGGYLLAGSSLSDVGFDKSQSNRGNRDFWIVKVDAQGNKQWDKRYGGTGDDELTKVMQLPSGKYILAGTSSSPANGEKSQGSQGGSDYWLLKVSSTGTKLWDKRYGGSNNEVLRSFAFTQDGGFLLVGSSLSGISGDKSQPSRGSTDFWVVKTGQQGELLWEKTYGGNGKDDAYSVLRQGPEFFISGTSNSAANGEKSQPSQGGEDYWVIKIGATGQKLWDKRFGGSKNDQLRASTRLKDGSLILAGTSFSEADGDKTQTSRGESDYWVVQVDAQGNKVYDKRFGGSRSEELRSILQTSDGGLLLGGWSSSAVSGEQSNYKLFYDRSADYWLVKVAPEVPSSAVTTSQQATAGEAPLIGAKQLTTYPNPFQEKVSIRFCLPETQPATLRIVDGQGKVIATLFQAEAQANQVYQLEWQAGKQEAGLYFLQLQTSVGQSTHKLLRSR
ncbi:T9SS type A sorting domain-containing protein [Adhaeribacter swui]|uniref:T9SS type A sorting domain-containing protein n=1 Tax=Adhaeribacter swui TaxID=2086471 RepID=A0A7G7G7G1_9BACT|nr:T9SS type A sorting domain-containing protein [Adhaeribacter swui]QNF33095.1 T9SS type A sorting domain-containing protein [Adhaeribacter swui]